MTYKQCWYYKDVPDTVGHCNLLGTYCQVELQQRKFCPETTDKETELLMDYVIDIIDAEEVKTP